MGASFRAADSLWPTPGPGSSRGSILTVAEPACRKNSLTPAAYPTHYPAMSSARQRCRVDWSAAHITGRIASYFLKTEWVPASDGLTPPDDDIR